MGKIKENTKEENKNSKILLKRIILIVLMFINIIAISFGIFLLIYVFNLIEEKNTSIENSIHTVVMEDTTIEGKFFYKEDLKVGNNIYILDEEIKEGKEYYKIKYNDRLGYVLKENVDYFDLEKNKEYVLMSDVSMFNKDTEFKTINDYEVFLLKNNINYVYIRLGGRGWGEKGVLYKDDEFGFFQEACEYLGVPYGFYYLDEALNSEEIDEEVEFVIDFLIKNKKENCKLPLVIDLEYQDGKRKSR